MSTTEQIGYKGKHLKSNNYFIPSPISIQSALEINNHSVKRSGSQSVRRAVYPFQITASWHGITQWNSVSIRLMFRIRNRNHIRFCTGHLWAWWRAWSYQRNLYEIGTLFRAEGNTPTTDNLGTIVAAVPISQAVNMTPPRLAIRNTHIKGLGTQLLFDFTWYPGRSRSHISSYIWPDQWWTPSDEHAGHAVASVLLASHTLCSKLGLTKSCLVRMPLPRKRSQGATLGVAWRVER